MPIDPDHSSDREHSPADHFETPAAPSLFKSNPLRDDSLDSTDPHHPLSGVLADQFPAEFGDYVLLGQIGRGGMGSVFRARQNSSGKIVALKLLRRGIFASRADVQRFEKEARIHANVASPNIAQLIEFGECNRMHFIVSEFVDGLDLQKLILAAKKLDSECALRIIRDVLQALDAIHRLGIVHRDVKPANIMILTNGDVAADRFRVADFSQAKLMDFGIARQIDQSESLAMTQTDMTLGTPLYMAPEQQEASRDVTAAADVYAVGATMYQLLAGHPPFRAEEKMRLAEMHRVEQPAALTRIDPAISEAISGVVLKALEKEPALRYADGGQMLLDIERLIAGQPTSRLNLPVVPKSEPAAVKYYNFSWLLKATPGALWPLVADTDRFNRALNLPPAEFSFDDTAGARKMYATARFNGMRLRWLEHPFHWVVGREMSILREFESGPFEWVTSTVFLEPQHGHRTRLRHEFQVKPRGLLGQIMTPFQIGFVTKRQLDRVYRRIESLARQSDNPLAGDAPFDKAVSLAARQLGYLEQTRRKLAATVEDQNLLDRLVDYLKFSADQSVARIRPLELAEKFRCDPVAFMAVCLPAVDAGLLQLMWDVICPVCRIASTTIDTLKNIDLHARCEVCNLGFQVDFASSVELIFRVDSRLRTVDTRTYCVGGPVHAPHVIAQNCLPGNKHVEYGLALAAGNYQFRSPQLEQPTHLMIDPACDQDRLIVEFPNRMGERLSIPDRFVAFQLRNQSPTELIVRLEQLAPPPRALSAAQACATPLFKKLFPDEVRSAKDLVNVQTQFLFACRIMDFETLVAERGEVAANTVLQSLIQNVLDNVQGSQLVSRSFSCFVIGIGQTESVILTCELILRTLESMAQKSAILLSGGKLQFTDSSTGREYFGKPIRDAEEFLRHCLPGQLIVRDTIYIDELLRMWLDQHSSPAESTEFTKQDSEFLVFNLRWQEQPKLN